MSDEPSSISTRELTHQVFERLPLGVLLTDSHGRIVQINETFMEMFSVSAAVLGRLTSEGIPLLAVHELVQEVLQGQGGEERSLAFEHRDLGVQALSLDGGVMVVVTDLSRFHRAERARTDFVANVSHELRTPIAAIMGYAETLLSESVPDHLMFMVEAVFRNSERLRTLSDDLLELYRIESRQREMPLSRMRLRPLLADAIGSAMDRAAQREQEFVFECEEDTEAWVNPQALVTIIGNLSVNACSYTGERGRVVVRVVRTEDEVQVQVQDNGIGIDTATQQRIFERFYRVDTGRSRREGGTGLGLAIVKHLAQASRCRVSLTSALGEGSTFVLHLPLREPLGRDLSQETFS